MLRTKDFILMDVLNIQGKKIGCIKDLIIDFDLKKIKGFVASTYGLFNKDVCIFNKDIVSFNANMIVKGFHHCDPLRLCSLKNMEVMNKNGDNIGMFEDLIFDREDFVIKAMVVSTGFVRNFIFGKKILLLDKIILGDKNIYCYNDNNKITLSSVPHKPVTEEKCYEKNI